jgi:hypothetical protein
MHHKFEESNVINRIRRKQVKPTEHNLEDLYIQLRNQQTCTSEKITKSGMVQFLVWFMLMFHHRFVNAPQI